MKKEVRQRLDGAAYDFLAQEKQLGDQVIYLVVSGSYGYGTAHAESDIDLRGCTVEGREVLFGLENFEQYEDLQTDTVVYGLKKFVRLGLSANPHVLELLGIEQEWIYKMTETGKLLRDNSHLFLSQKAVDSFGGYAMSQLRRIQNALCTDTSNQPLRQKHIADTLTRQIKQFNEDYTAFGEGGLEVYTDDAYSELYMNVNLQGYPLRDFAGIYANMTNTLKSYEKLTHRNRKKELGKLHKHAMHLVRLLITGTSILEGKGIQTRLEEHLPMLLEIRHGQYSWEKIFQIVDYYENRFNQATQLTHLPMQPDYEEVGRLMARIYEMHYGL